MGLTIPPKFINVWGDMVAEIGWIRLDRQIKNHWLWEEKPFDKKSAWIDLLLTANHEDKKFLLGNELIEAKRGEIVTSEVKLAERWGWSRKKVRIFFELLESDGMIVKKSDTRKTVLVIINYSKYQDINKDTLPKESEKRDSERNSQRTGLNADEMGICSNSSYEEGPAKGTALEQQRNSGGTQTTINNNINNINSAFENLWKLYPNKKGKGQVSQAKKKEICTVGYDEMVRCINRYIKDLKKDSWRKPQNGSTFFNSGYVDYLDKNYSETTTTNCKKEVTQLDGYANIG